MQGLTDGAGRVPPPGKLKRLLDGLVRRIDIAKRPGDVSPKPHTSSLREVLRERLEMAAPLRGGQHGSSSR